MFLTIEQTIFKVEKQFIFSLDVQWPCKCKYPCSNLFLHHFPIGSDDSKIRHLHIYVQKKDFIFIRRINYFEGSKTSQFPYPSPSPRPIRKWESEQYVLYFDGCESPKSTPRNAYRVAAWVLIIIKVFWRSNCRQLCLGTVVFFIIMIQ